MNLAAGLWQQQGRQDDKHSIGYQKEQPRTTCSVIPRTAEHTSTAVHKLGSLRPSQTQSKLPDVPVRAARAQREIIVVDAVNCYIISAYAGQEGGKFCRQSVGTTSNTAKVPKRSHSVIAHGSRYLSLINTLMCICSIIGCRGKLPEKSGQSTQ